jgi:hypothetical protein
MAIVQSSRTIEYIKYDEEKLEELKELLKGNVSKATRRDKIKKLAGGTCCKCDGIPTKIINYDIEGGGSLIQRYCDRC